MEKDREKLGKLVNLAKQGVGGEKTTAIKLVKKLCKKLDLNYKDVMSEDKVERAFSIECQKSTAILLAHVIIKYAYDGDGTKEIRVRYDEREIYFKATKEKYIEVVHAFNILARVYKKEKKFALEAYWYGFLEKHDLYAKKVAKSKKEDEIDEDEQRARQMGSSMSRNMKDADIHKALKSENK